MQPGIHGAAEAIPARQHQTALRPAEDPRNRAQVLDAVGWLARGRAAADVQLRDLGDHRRFAEVGGEALGFIDQPAVGLERQLRERVHDRTEGLRFGLLFQVEQGRFQRSGSEDFQVAATDFRVRVFRGDDFALFGDADLPGNGAGRLREDGLIARAAAAADRAAAAVEQAQANLVLAEHLGQLDFGLVQFPARSQEATVLVAVGVAKHDLVFVAARGDQRPVGGQAEDAVHDAGAVLQVADSLEQRDDVHCQ